MSIIANNNVNSINSQLIPELQGLKIADGTVINGNFLNIISMLSDSSEFSLTTKENPELLLDVQNTNNNFSTLQLLQKFLDEHGVNTKEKVQPEVASKFLELFKSVDKPTAPFDKPTEPFDKTTGSFDKPIEDIEAAIGNELNLQSLPIGKVLITAALKHLEKNFLQGDLSPMTSDRSKTVSTETSVKIKFSDELPLDIDGEEHINKAMLAHSVIDTTLFESSEPRAVVIEIGHIVDQVSEEFNQFQISKVFTRPEEKLDEANEYQDAKISETISSLSINLKPGLVTALAETETSPAIYKEVLIPDEDRAQDKVIVLEIDKVEGDTVIAKIMSDHLNEPACLPKKIVLEFSETKPAGSKPSVNLLVISEENFIDTEVSIDTNHATLLTKENGDRSHSLSETNSKIKIFNSDFIEVSDNKPEWKNSEIEIFSKDFSDALAARLKTYISGEFNNKNMLTSLRESLIIEDNKQILADVIKVQHLDLLKSIRFKPKARLMLSTADVLGYRDAIKISEKQLSYFQVASSFDDITRLNELKPIDFEFSITKEKELTKQGEDNFSKLNLLEPAKHSYQLTTTDSRILASPTTNSGVNSVINSLNLYEAQFTSRLGMLLADQLSQGNENFELQLEPESFGKVRINVSLENSNVEVKMTAENPAAVLALRGGELMLQNIAEQYGLKLSDYSVDMQNNQNGQSSDQKEELRKNGEMQKNSIEDVEQDLSSNGADGNYKLNLLA